MKSFRSIHSRLFLLFLASMLSLLFVVSVLYYQRATEQIRNRIADIADKNISQTVGLFDLLLKGYDSVTKTLNSNDELMRLLQSRLTDDPVLGVDNERKIRNILGAIFYSRDDIVGIHIVTYSGKVHSYERSSGGSGSGNYTQAQWFRSLKESTGEMKWLGVFPQSLMSGGFDRPVFAFGRQLFELNELKPIGIVLIETDAEAILSALSNASLGPGSSVSIHGAAGETIVTTSGRNSFEPLPAGWPGQLREDETFVRERRDSLVTAARIAKAEWTIVAQTPKSNMQLELKQTQQFLMTVIIVLVVVATVLATFVSRTFSSPFKRLLQEMKQVEMGNFNGRISVNSYDEINVLVSSFNRMVARMDELIERIKLSSISEKHSQLQALQSQVNPHFLFNTLDMIYWMLDERENDRLGKVILALSHIFRYSSDWEEASRTTLRSELEQMQHYLTIIETRLPAV
ncbi:sensor histidine kinase [Cohnella kolymensis]|uniref:sensor histidine kinase n=1 Tax=Cohnella kolymensis TaxID=1590652 RepID=UPI000A80F10E